MDYSNPDSIRQEYESDLHWERARRHHRVLSAVVILLILLMAGAAWYAYPILGKHDVLLSHLPDVQKQVFSLGEQAKASDAKVDDWSSRQEELRSQLNQARGQLMARIDSAKKQAGDATAALTERMRSEIARQIDGMQTRLARLETSTTGDQTQIAQLRQELTQVRGQMSQQAQELATVRGDVDKNSATSDRELAAVKTNQQHDRKDFDTYADKFAVKRVDFEVTKNHSTQVGPGIALEVNGTDVSYQRVNGSVLVMPERRTIWLRQLKVQDPVFLSSFEDGRTRELVITRVNKNGALGYVLVPAQDSANAAVTSQARAE